MSLEDGRTEAPGPPDLRDKVASWLQAHGYPLEMRTAAILSDAGLKVHPAWYYEDIETQQQRETDVMAVASDKDDRVRVFLAVECKSTAGKPWVLFAHRERRPVHEKVMAFQRFSAPARSPFWKQVVDTPELRNLPLLQSNGVPGYSLTKVSFGSSGNTDASYAALLSAVKAAAGIHAWLAGGPGLPSAHFESLVIPVLVLDAPLFSCRLDQNAEIELEEITAATLLWKYQLPGSPPTSIVSVVTEGALPALANQAKEAAAALGAAHGPT